MKPDEKRVAEAVVILAYYQMVVEPELERREWVQEIVRQRRERERRLIRDLERQGE